jgi:hypothetical protein
VEVELDLPDNLYFWIQEEDEDEASRYPSPYTRLAEWRDMT